MSRNYLVSKSDRWCPIVTTGYPPIGVGLASASVFSTCGQRAPDPESRGSSQARLGSGPRTDRRDPGRRFPKWELGGDGEAARHQLAHDAQLEAAARQGAEACRGLPAQEGRCQQGVARRGPQGHAVLHRVHRQGCARGRPQEPVDGSQHRGRPEAHRGSHGNVARAREAPRQGGR